MSSDMERHEEHAPSVEEALTYLLPEALKSLDALLEAPRTIAKAALSLMPLGDREAMLDLGIIVHDGDTYDLTDFGVEVALAAREREN